MPRLRSGESGDSALFYGDIIHDPDRFVNPFSEIFFFFSKKASDRQKSGRTGIGNIASAKSQKYQNGNRAICTEFFAPAKQSARREKREIPSRFGIIGAFSRVFRTVFFIKCIPSKKSAILRFGKDDTASFARGKTHDKTRDILSSEKEPKKDVEKWRFFSIVRFSQKFHRKFVTNGYLQIAGNRV